MFFGDFEPSHRSLPTSSCASLRRTPGTLSVSKEELQMNGSDFWVVFVGFLVDFGYDVFVFFGGFCVVFVVCFDVFGGLWWFWVACFYLT